MAIHFDGLNVDGLGALVDVLEASPDCVKILDAEGRIHAINSAGCAFLCQSSHALEGRLWAEFLPEPVREAARRAVAGALEGATLRLSTPCETPHGIRHCDLTVSPLRSAGGARVVAILAVTRDVTDLVLGRLAAEQSARDMARQSAALRAAGLVAKLGAWEIDYQRKEIFWSDEIWTLMGQVPRPLALEDADSVLSGEDREQLRAALQACAQSGEPFALDVPVTRNDETRIWVRIFGERDLGGQILRGAVQDITAQRAAEAELVAARDAAQAASAAQSAFLANVSHEIRTPLHGILGMAQVMETEAPTPLQRERLTIIRQSGDTLMALLNDILDLAKIESGHIELREREFDLAAALTAACGPFTYLAAQRDLAFEVMIEPETAGRWIGDELRLRQILSNLVSNAVKFTQAGSINVLAQATPHGLAISVADTGQGIFPGDVGQLFEKFSQGRGPGVNGGAGVRGTGLGLAICRQLAHLMGGEVSVETALGRGSTFELSVPLQRASPPEASIAAKAAEDPFVQAGPLRILAAEDNPTNQLILRSMLAPLGVELLIVGDGLSAVEAMGVASFDIILMDIQMPRLDGVEATKRIRALERDHDLRSTPIVALSANVMAHQVESYRAAGMDDVVEKPIDLARLYAVLESVVEAR
ncbi:ATP-binding protein [Caulobacter endophyticus]|uniref:histidine kinase n=1 Tax=Caulobacter endophyticus TaxID=2172652 RepID=A0A2T9K1M6_9CAUL|nr:ATP-binding protein [Caulobacter endophyticus]PVM89773.1 hybrid sensor histidine kinase/response regulator [Caulobacter endophyticus]